MQALLYPFLFRRIKINTLSLYHYEFKRENLMEKNEEKKIEENANVKKTVAKTKKRKVSKTWEAMQRLKGSLIVNDPKFLL